MTRRLAVLVNPAAAGGRALRALPQIRAELDRLGTDYHVVETTSVEHARDAAETAAAERRSVVAVGGDGLVGALAGVLRGSPCALGIVPGGRGNDFARVLSIPTEPAAAARCAAQAPERRVDVAELNGAAFVGIASVGLDSDTQDVANRTRLVRGKLVYVYAALRALAGWRHASFRVTIDGEPLEVRGYAVAVANSGVYGGGMKLVPHARIDDGLLDVVATSARLSKLRCLQVLPKLFRGTHVDEPGLTFTTGRVIEIAADRPFVAYADGDPIGELPATVRVDHHGLRVIAPDG